MADNKVACPVCGRHFRSNFINTHVNSCLSEADDPIECTDDDSNGSEDCQPAKRQKTDDSSYKKTLGAGAGRVQTSQSSVKTMSTSSRAESKRQAAWGCLAPVKITQKVTSPNEKSNLVKSQTVNSAKLTQNKPSIPQVSKKENGGEHPFFATKRAEVQYKQNQDVSNQSQQPSATPIEQIPCPSDPQSQGGPTKSKKVSLSGMPLAEQMRPKCLAEYFGQEEVLGHNKLLRSLVESHQIPSMIIWGPPGCGKTTLARIIAERCKESHNTRFVQLSATTSGIADVKEVVKAAKNQLAMFKRRTILFVDEVHRFNKLQQDSFLPHVEDGSIVLIGATTENPSFQVNNALLSRCRVIVLNKLSVECLLKILERALIQLQCMVLETDSLKIENQESCGRVYMEQAALTTLAKLCDGDARAALNALQLTVESKVAAQELRQDADTLSKIIVNVDDVKEGLQRSHVQYDRTGEEHYNCASALQKSIRGSSDQGAIYWMTRMMEGGEDPLFIARRMVVTASEDIGLADNQALPLAVATFQACQLLGPPECAIPLAHCATYLARASKSNESYRALAAARQSIRNHEGPLPGVPLHLRNAPTKLMKNIGYGRGYKYSHAGGDKDQEYLPPELKKTNFFA